MNHCVPDFEIQMDDDEDYPIPISSALPRPKKPYMQNDEIMELLWQNGQVVMQSQNQRQLRKPPPPPASSTDGVIPAVSSSAREIRSSEAEENYRNQHLFMQEDEMASWLHYSIHEDPQLDHHDFCADILYPPPHQNHNGAMQTTVRTAAARPAAPRPPIPPPRRPEQVASRVQNFAHFSKHNIARAEPEPSSRATAALESTVVDSCDTPVATARVAAAVSRVSETVRSSAEQAETGRGSMSAAGKAAAVGGGTGGRETATCEMTVTSSPGGSSGSAEPDQRKLAMDRKRKGREPEESESQGELCHVYGGGLKTFVDHENEEDDEFDGRWSRSGLMDVDFESPEAKKQVRGSTSTKRSRAAEVHNLSERRRRDRINEKMRALQELIPRCNKSDKASMLDEAIEYLKSLQLQVQMMSMGCGMVPMMFPGIQQYLPPMGMGIGMGMGMEMGMNRPVMPFPNMLASSALPAATAAAHLGQRFPMPSFHMFHVPVPDSSRMQATNQSDNMLTPDPDQSRIPNFTDPYQQFLGPHQMQLQLMQNQATNQPNVSKPSISRSQENPGKHQSG